MHPVVVNIFYLKINVIQSTSSLNIGHNHMADWNSFTKSYTGTGSTYGDQSCMYTEEAYLDDSDLMDMPIVEETFPNKAPGFLK